MFRITNLTDRDIDIQKDVVLKAHNHVDIDIDINSRLSQLINMNIIRVQEISIKDNLSQTSKGVLRRKQFMNHLK